MLLPVCVLVLMLRLNVYVVWRERAALGRSGAKRITAGSVMIGVLAWVHV